MRHTSDTKVSDDLTLIYLSPTNHCLVFLFKFLFLTVFVPHIFFHSASEEGLYCKAKYREILFKMIESFLPFHFILVISAVWISVPSRQCPKPASLHIPWGNRESHVITSAILIVTLSYVNHRFWSLRSR